MTKEEKERLIKSEETSLKRMFSKVAGSQKKLVTKLCAKAAYLKISLEEIQEDIDEKGYYEKFSQGKDQEPYERTRPVVNTFTSFTAAYQKYMKQLSDILPKEDKTTSGDGFEEFIYGRED